MIIQEYISLADYCTYRTGGAARYFALPTNYTELKEALAWGAEKAVSRYLVGSGSNVLFPDSGVDGLVISLLHLNRYITRNRCTVYAGAGVQLDRLVEYCAEAGLSGMENMSGIPGTVGGAVSMNAGAFGTEVKDVAVSIDLIDMHGERRMIPADEAGFGYRSACGIAGCVVLGVSVELLESTPEAVMQVRRDILAKREEKQPLEYPSCGSVFKRPEGNYAGTLVEQCGLKGFRIGGAEVSTKHANFIVNIGGAKTSDIIGVIRHVQKTVKEQTGYTLEEEVRYIGFA